MTNEASSRRRPHRDAAARRFHSPVHPLRHELSPELRKVGLRIFGSSLGLAFALNTTGVHHVNVLGGALSLQLASLRADRSARLLADGMRHERYGVTSLPHSGVVVDVGANVGDFALTVAKLRPAMRVIAIEPVPSTYFFLRLNLELNGIPYLSASHLANPRAHGVIAINSAVAGENASSFLPVSYPLTGDSKMAAVNARTQNAGGSSSWRTIEVPSLLLPEYLSRHGISW